jgi:hypothetical protein
MIDADRLLADLKRLRRRLDVDLRQAHAAGAGRAEVEVEWRVAREAGRTAETFETFFDVALDQACVHWVLACVFLRFLEDNGLVERPVLGGPGERLDLARERHAAYFRKHPHDSDLDYLLDTFAETARLPGLSGLFDPAHNPLFRLPVSGDGAIALREFFQVVVPETGRQHTTSLTRIGAPASSVTSTRTCRRWRGNFSPCGRRRSSSKLGSWTGPWSRRSENSASARCE